MHWGALVTGGVFIGGLTIYQGVGHSVAPWVYWTIAADGLFWAAFLAWRAEFRKAKELEDKVRTLEAAAIVPPVQNIYFPAPSLPAKPDPLKHNVQCLGVKIEDLAVTICFQNVPIPGKPIGDFRNARLSVEYRLEATGEEWLTIFPARWIGGNQDQVSIGITPQHAFLAAYYPMNDRKWKALISLEKTFNDFSWADRINGMPKDRLRVKATLIDEENLSLQPITGILALGEEGKASWTPTAQ
jgi:hypothetical protein